MAELIGNFDPTNNIFALISEADPRVVDDNTGNALTYNGESAVALRTGVPTSCTTGYGYVYNGGNPYYLFDGVDDNINFGNITELDSVSSFTCLLNFETSSFSTGQWIWLKYQPGFGKIIGLFLTDNNELIAYINDGSNNITYTIASGMSINTKTSVAVVYDGSGVTNADRLKIIVNGVNLTGGVYSGTVPSTTQTVVGDLTLGYISGGLIGKSYDFIIYSDTKSTQWISDQYDDTINGYSVIGTDNGDGTLTLSVTSSGGGTNITATLDGEAVTVVGITKNGNQNYIVYVDSSNNLKYKIKQEETVATSATIN